MEGRSNLEQYMAKLLGLPNHAEDLRQGILMDLYLETIRYGKAAGFPADRMSAFFSIVKVNHFQATDERLTMEKSFQYFKDLLLRHSVHRPPYSIGLFSFQEIKAITDHMIDTYYRHYKLYQYAFTKRYTLDFKEPPPLVEVMPELVPLAEGMSSRKWQEYQDELQKVEAEKREQEEKAAAAAAEEKAEQERLAEYMSAIPDEIFAQVQKVFEEKMVDVRADMENQFKTQEENLLNKISALEEAAGAAGSRPVSGKPGSGKGKKK